MDTKHNFESFENLFATALQESSSQARTTTAQPEADGRQTWVDPKTVPAPSEDSLSEGGPSGESGLLGEGTAQKNPRMDTKHNFETFENLFAKVDPKTVPLPDDDSLSDEVYEPPPPGESTAQQTPPEPSVSPQPTEQKETDAVRLCEPPETARRINIAALKTLFWFWLAALRKLRLWLTVVKWRRKVLFFDPAKKRVSLVGLQKNVTELERTLEHDDTQLRKLLVKLQNGALAASVTDRYALMMCQKFLLDYCTRRLCRARSEVAVVMQEVRSGRFQMDTDNLANDYDLFVACDMDAVGCVE